MGFKIIRDFVSDKGESNAVGIESAPPRHWLQGFIGWDMDDKRYNYNGGTIKVRLRDDDGGICYHALLDSDDEHDLEMILRWGGGYAGVTQVDMHIDNYKELYGEPKYPQYLSKDGKWYSYAS